MRNCNRRMRVISMLMLIENVTCIACRRAVYPKSSSCRRACRARARRRQNSSSHGIMARHKYLANVETYKRPFRDTVSALMWRRGIARQRRACALIVKY